jgi:DNA adenine methylase
VGRSLRVVRWVDTIGSTTPIGQAPLAKCSLKSEVQEIAMDHDDLTLRARRYQSTSPRPFLRWAGSKRALVQHFLPFLPTEFKRYYEPFVGAGSMFFLLRPREASLGDTCTPLIETYRTVRNEHDQVLEHLKSFEVSREAYYLLREESSNDAARRAALFIYFNKTAWNGLYRVNASGKFNVPFGRPKSSNLIDSDNLVNCAKLLDEPGVSLASQDFETTLATANAGDLAFLDPPYVTGHENNGFVDYNEKLFSWNDQERLARVATEMSNRGVDVLVANASHDNVRNLYPDFREIVIERSSTLAGDKKHRKLVREALFVSNRIRASPRK